MKIIPLPKSGAGCHRCKKDLIVYTTPNGADYATCPLCDQCVDYYDDDNDDNDNNDDNNNNNIPDFFCNKCGILFKDGCMHAMNGCTDGVYYAQLIYQVTIDGKTINGMPVFDSLLEAKNIYPSLNCQWVCSCEGIENQCANASYKSYPNINYGCDRSLLIIKPYSVDANDK